MLWDNIAHIIVSILIAVFCSLYVNKAGLFVDKIINSCENGAPLVNGACDCTGLPFTGKNCQTSTCVNGWGVYDLNDNPHTMSRPDSLWACYCTGRWSGYNCDRCNAQEDCKGPCKDGYHGDHCQNTCFDNLTRYTHYKTDTQEGVACVESENNGGKCNYCAGNGVCSGDTCKCNEGYYDFKSGSEVRGCELECPMHNGTFCSGHGECQSTGLAVNCVCQTGYAGDACQYSCLNKCSGIGTCVVAESTAYCSCPDRTRGEYCQHTCPGLSICSGRGSCDKNGVCTCDGDWKGEACNCQESTTCSGHGSCQADGTCVCEGNWDCTVNKCLEGWYGSDCDVQCSANTKCSGHGACDQSGACRCDSGWDGERCDECAQDVFPKARFSNPCLTYITRTTCNNHGNPNYLYGGSSQFSGMCICESNWDDRSNCDKCKPNWYGEDCNTYCDVNKCYKGRCSESGTCICEDDWFGENCDTTCGGDVPCSGHGTCVQDLWNPKRKSKCSCDEGYGGSICDISAPMSSKSICNGRGVSKTTVVSHSGLTFDCETDTDCGNFLVEPPSFEGSNLTVPMQRAFTQAVFGSIGPSKPYGPVCSVQRVPDNLLGKSGSVGEHAMTDWSPSDITNGPFYIQREEGFVYPLFRQSQTGFIGTQHQGVQFYGRNTNTRSLGCEYMDKTDAQLAGCTWLDTGFCEYIMQSKDASDWCYQNYQYNVRNCQQFSALECTDLVNVCDTQCTYTDAQTAINEWNAKHMNTPFDGEDLIRDSFNIVVGMYLGDDPSYDVGPDCEKVLTWDIPILVYKNPRWQCQHDDISFTLNDGATGAEENCKEIDSRVSGFEGFTVRGVQYDTFKEAVAALEYGDTIVRGNHHEYAERMTIDEMCQYYNHSFTETWRSDSLGEFNGTYEYLEYSFKLTNFNKGALAFINELENSTNSMTIVHGRHLEMRSSVVTVGPALELNTLYTVRLRFGENVTCENVRGVSCPSPVSTEGDIVGMRYEAGGTEIFSLHAYNRDGFDDMYKRNSWRLQMPPGWSSAKSIWKLCNERYGVLVRSPALCQKRVQLSTHLSALSREETLKCVRRLENSCPAAKLNSSCEQWQEMGRPDVSMCPILTSNPTGFSNCDSSNWESWCEKLKNDKLPGKCATNQCDCNMDTYLGIAGEACQLSCPVNSVTGTACGYRNPPEYPYGECKDIPSTQTVTPSTCECTRSVSESCEEKCDDSNTPDCNDGIYGTELLRSFDCWGFGSEVSYEHRLSLTSYQQCSEYLAHHPATKVTRAGGSTEGSGLCRWTEEELTWGSDTGNLIDLLVTSEEGCKELNSGMGLYKEETSGDPGTVYGNGLVYANGIVMRPNYNGTKLYDIKFTGDTTKLHMKSGSNVLVGNQLVEVYSETQVLTAADISAETEFTSGGVSGANLTLADSKELWICKTDIIVPMQSEAGAGVIVYEVSNGYLYTLGEPYGDIEIPVNVSSVTAAGYIYDIGVNVGSGYVNGDIPIVSYGTRIYSPLLGNGTSVNIWTGTVFTMTDVTKNTIIELEVNRPVKIGDKLGSTKITETAPIMVENASFLTNQYFEKVLSTTILNVTKSSEKICEIECTSCTKTTGLLLSQGNSSGLIFSLTPLQILTENDWVEDEVYTSVSCKRLTSVIVETPFSAAYEVEIHQGSESGRIWDNSGNLLIIAGGEITVGACDFYKLPVDVTVLQQSVNVISAKTSVLVSKGNIESEGKNGTVIHTDGNSITFVSDSEWSDGLAVYGYITTYTATSVKAVQLVSINPVFVVAPEAKMSTHEILDTFNGMFSEFSLVGLVSDKLVVQRPPSEYGLFNGAEPPSSLCPANGMSEITTAELCQEAVNKLYTGMNVNVGSWSPDPKGCWFYKNGDSEQVYFNTHPNPAGGGKCDWSGYTANGDYTSYSQGCLCWNSPDSECSNTNKKIYEYGSGLDGVINVGDVVHQETSVGVVSSTNPLRVESSDTFKSGTMTIGSPMEFSVTVTTANDIINLGGKTCSVINEVHVWGSNDQSTLAKRVKPLESTCNTVDNHPATSISGSGNGCSYNNTHIMRGENIGNDIGALVRSEQECSGFLDYHPSETMLRRGGPICSFNDTHVSWGPDNIGVLMGVPTGIVRLGISQCEGGLCRCKSPNNAYFYKTRTSALTGRSVKIRQTKYFGKHKGTNFMQGPQPYLINHVKHNNDPITEQNWESKYEIWLRSKNGFTCSNPLYAKKGESCTSNTICIDTVCVNGKCKEPTTGDIDEYTGIYKYEQCLVDNLILSSMQGTSAYMGLLCNDECPGITEYGTPCSGHGTCSRTGVCTCQIASTMVKYTQNTRQIIKNEAGKPLISFLGSESMKMEERTGWRGDACELMCPGYDPFNADMTGICSGHGQCSADAKCICEIGYTGENCQLDCPNTKNLKIQCSGHGVCQPSVFEGSISQIVAWEAECPDGQLMLKGGAECGSTDTFLGDFDTLEGCTSACSTRSGCQYFIYGTSHTACYWEKTSSGSCPEGWVYKNYNFYELSKEKPLNTVEINGHQVSELQFYEHVESTSNKYMDANGEIFELTGYQKSNYVCSSGYEITDADTCEEAFNQLKAEGSIPLDSQYTAIGCHIGNEVYMCKRSIVTPGLVSKKNKVYPLRIVGPATGQATLIPTTYPRGGPNCESTMITNKYKIRPQLLITRYNDEDTLCDKTEELKQTCDILDIDTLQCAMCACPPTIYNGFWGGLDCRTCMLGYGGLQCKKPCPGYNGADSNTICGGIGTCLWGSIGGLGNVFREPSCVCGDDPNEEKGYKQCDLYVDGNREMFYNTITAGTCKIPMTLSECQNAHANIQAMDSSFEWTLQESTSQYAVPKGCSIEVSSSGKVVYFNTKLAPKDCDYSTNLKCMCGSKYKENGGSSTCSCENGMSGLFCDQSLPTCLFGGVQNKLTDQCTCSATYLSKSQNCCPEGLTSTSTLKNRLLPTYITDSMTYEKYSNLNMLTETYVKYCYPQCGVKTLENTNGFSELWDYIHTVNTEGGAQFQECSGHGTCINGVCACNYNECVEKSDEIYGDLTKLEPKLGSWSHVPPGCSVETISNTYQLHINTHDGGENSAFAPIVLEEEWQNKYCSCKVGSPSGDVSSTTPMNTFTCSNGCGNNGGCVCPAGYKKMSEISCEQCPRGYYQNEEDQTGCKICTLGYWSAEEGRASECDAISAGNYGHDYGLWYDGSPCNLGKYQDEFAKTSCKGCLAGKYQDERGNTVCKECQVGRYQPSSEETVCYRCNEGRYSDEKGLALCKLCEAGKASSLYITDAETCQNVVNTQTWNTASWGSYISVTNTEVNQPGCWYIKSGINAGKVYFNTHLYQNNYLSSSQVSEIYDGNANTELIFNQPEITNTCYDCPVGRFAPAGQYKCLPCDAGRWTYYTGSAECSSCQSFTVPENAPIGVFNGVSKTQTMTGDYSNGFRSVVWGTMYNGCVACPNGCTSDGLMCGGGYYDGQCLTPNLNGQDWYPPGRL